MFKNSAITNTILQKYVMENRVNDNFRLLYMVEYRGGYARKICANYRANQKILLIELNLGDLWNDSYILRLLK